MAVGLARVVGDDADEIHRQLADAPAVEQVGQAMVELRDQQHDPALRRSVAQGPGHAEARRRAARSRARRASSRPRRRPGRTRRA